MAETPRQMRLTFELQVREGVGTNFRGARIEKIMNTITERVVGMVTSLFSEIGTIKVRQEWIYNWNDKTRVIEVGEDGDTYEFEEEQ